MASSVIMKKDPSQGRVFYIYRYISSVYHALDHIRFIVLHGNEYEHDVGAFIRWNRIEAHAFARILGHVQILLFIKAYPHRLPHF